jgi:broad specificity phosphatase PhoE
MKPRSAGYFCLGRFRRNPVKNTLIAALVLLATISCPAYAQRAVIIVRHADRLDQSEDSPLSQAGEDRAQRLAGLLKDAGITAIYTSQRLRTKNTAEPLASALKVKPVSIPVADHREPLLDRIRADNRDDVVLIVSHETTVPVLLKLLGYPGDIAIARTEYDNLFVVVPQDNGSPAVVRLRY